ncbi:MAG: helix-turn-helix domain-containing protein [Coriobacteriales bacterium]|jgi:transcriptional regulator with XRE-family HTH domain|nr:helix-turn-helix domain-containing protein [Coriobacteriales bacterium]
MEQILGNNLKKLRESCGISQEKLAREIDVSLGTINNWEARRRDIPAKKLVAIAGFFRCSLGEVMGVSDLSGQVLTPERPGGAT